MQREYKVSELKQLVWNCKAVATANVLNFETTLAVNRLAKLIREIIEEKYEADLDHIHASKVAIEKEVAEIAKKATKREANQQEAASRKFLELMNDHEKYREILEKEESIMETKLPLSCKPVKVETAVKSGKDLSERMPKSVPIKYRSNEMQYNPHSAFLELIDEGLLEIVKPQTRSEPEEED